MMLNRIGWYDISRVVVMPGGIFVQANIDAVFANGEKDAIRVAAERNGLKPWEEFGARRAQGGIGINQSVTRHYRRSSQIEELKELIEQHV